MNVIELFETLEVIKHINNYVEINTAYNKDLMSVKALKDIFNSIGISFDDSINLKSDELNRLNKINIIIPNRLLNWKSQVQRAYYQLRGKPVTIEQALDIIKRTESLFVNMLQINDGMKLWNLTTDIINAYYIENSWVHKNGVIGIDSYTNSYVSIPSLVRDSFILLSNFKYLDFVWAITYWDGTKYNRKRGDIRLKDFLENVDIGLKICGDTIEIMDKRKAQETYEKYKDLYENDKIVYKPIFRYNKDITREEKEYAERLVEAVNFKLGDIKKYM